jgi:hypothetical protein
VAASRGGVSTMFEVISMEAKEFDEELNEVGVNLVTAQTVHHGLKSRSSQGYQIEGSK